MTTVATPSAPSGGPTPPQEDQPANTYATYVPHDLTYSGDFEDSLITPVLHHSSSAQSDDAPHVATGIRVIPPSSTEVPVSGVSIRAADISPESLPTVHESDLPLPLTDPRRKFASPLPGVLLTHPHGYLEGGPPLDPTLDTFAEDFLSHRPHITTPKNLETALQKEIDEQIGVLRERLRHRQKAKERNEQVARELKVLTDQHSMELRIQERMQEDARRKKEARMAMKGGREGVSADAGGG